jgi:glycosyltransferase involved in cell wall biosynthesis
MKAGQHRPRQTVSIVSPCYNEADGIDAFHAELSAVLDCLSSELDFTIVVVDDGSTDGSLDRLNALAARDPRVRVYSLSRNFGHQIALSAGLDVAVGDAVIMMDSDLQHPSALIPALLERWRAGYDIVSAIRRRSEGASFLKNLTSRAFYWLFNHLSDVQIPTGAADFGLLSRRAWAALQSMPERHRFLRGMIAWIGFPRTFVFYEAPARAAGVSKYTPRRMLALALDAVCSFGTNPLRLAMRIGLMLVLAGTGYLCYVLLRYWFLRDTALGWPSLISTVVILGGAQICLIGVVGTYLGRVFEQVKVRPLYFFKQCAPSADAVPAPSLSRAAEEEPNPCVK